MEKTNKKTTQLEKQEIATTDNGRDITRGYVDHLPYLQPTDQVLQLRGGHNYELYEGVLRDAQVHATLAQRRLAVVSRQTQVVPGGNKRADKKATAFIEEVLKHIRWDTVTDRMLYGRFYGYAVSEALWDRDGAHIVLDKLKVRNRRRFVFDAEFRPKLLTTANFNGEVLPDKKFWWFSTGADHDDEPYGLGLAHWLYWPVWFKTNHTKFWLTFSEKFGQPTVVGKYPKGTPKDQQQKLQEAVTAIRTDTGITVPEGVMIELLEASRSGAVDYAAFFDRMDALIAKVVLGQTMTTENGSSRSQAEVHMDVRQDLVSADVNLICDSFNRSIVRWLVDWNFPGAAYPQVTRNMDDAPDLQKLATRDKIIHDMGYTPTQQYIEDTYNIEVEHKSESSPKSTKPGTTAEFAEEDKIDELEQVLNSIDNESWKQVSNALLQPILTKAKTDPDSLLDDLASLYPELNTDSLVEQLERILFVADVWGRLQSSE